MDFVGFLRFVSEHNETVFGTLAGATLLTSIVLLVRSVGDKTPVGGGLGANDLGKIEDTLKKILEKTAAAPAAAPAPVAEPTESVAKGAVANQPPPGIPPEELDKWKATVVDRDKKISALQAALEKAQLAATNVSAGGGEGDPIRTLELENKLRDLQARLAEYEIIEDDIADLSLYKEENARLKAALEAFKNGEASLPSEPVAAAAPPAPEPAPPPPKPEPKPEPQFDVPKPPTDPEVGLTVDDDVMAEFAQAVQEQKAASPEAATRIDLPENAPAAAAPAGDDINSQLAALTDQLANLNTETGPVSQDDIDALFAVTESQTATPSAPAPAVESVIPEAEPVAFEPEPVAQAVAEPVPAPAPEPAAAQPVADPFAEELNPNKVMEEVGDLEKVAGADDGGDAFAAVLDTDKLLEEVNALGGGGQESSSLEDDLLSEFKDLGSKGGK